jgi:hypothetical protein
VRAAEKQAQKLRDEARAEREAIAKERAALEEARKQAGDFAQRVKADPLGALTQYGVSFEQVARQVLNSPDPAAGETPAAAAAAPPELAAVKQELAEVKRYVAQTTQERAVNEYRDKLRAELSKTDYELLRAHPAAEAEMLQFAAKYAAAKGEVLTPDRVASILQDEWRDYLKSLGSHAAIRQALGLSGSTQPAASASASSAKAEASQQPAASQSPGTLTNDMGTTRPQTAKKDWSAMSEREQLEEAAKLVPPDAWRAFG